MSTTAVSAADLAANDNLAAAYVARRLRELQALQADMADPNNGYCTVSRCKAGIQIQTRTETVIAVSMVAAQAFVLARFW